jgi:hypothetical protein
MVLLAPPLAALMASLKLTKEVQLLALLIDSASAREVAVELACTVASANVLRFRLCKPAAEGCRWWLRWMAGNGRCGYRYRQPPIGP